MSARKKNSSKPAELPVPGWPRPYVRDGVPGLPLERQEEILGEFGLDLSDGKVYRDSLSRAKIRARAPLPERDLVVAPRHHGETVYVASLRVLGWDHLDVNRALVAADKAEAKVYCADVGQVIAADTPPGELLQMLIRSEEARRRARTSRAVEGQLSRRAKRLSEGLEIARREWSGPLTVVQIAEMAKLSTRTLYQYLPPRSGAREENMAKSTPDQPNTTESDAETLCREVGVDPKRSPSLEEIRDLMLHVARRSGSWRNAGLALVDQLNGSLGNNGEKYCALCFALGLVAAQETRIGPGLRFAAPLIAEELLKGD